MCSSANVQVKCSFSRFYPKHADPNVVRAQQDFSRLPATMVKKCVVVNGNSLQKAVPSTTIKSNFDDKVKVRTQNVYESFVLLYLPIPACSFSL